MQKFIVFTLSTLTILGVFWNSPTIASSAVQNEGAYKRVVKYSQNSNNDLLAQAVTINRSNVRKKI